MPLGAILAFEDRYVSSVIDTIRYYTLIKHEVKKKGYRKTRVWDEKIVVLRRSPK